MRLAVYCLLILMLDVVYVVNAATRKRYTPVFADAQDVGTVRSSAVDEASGVAASRSNRNILYTLNDSGGGTKIYALDARDGHVYATLDISGARNHDWEDIAVGPCPDGGNCMYIGDIGGNVHYEANVIYRLREPEHMRDHAVPVDATLHYSWHERNAETLMVDPDANIYIISKVDGGSGKIYKLPKDAWNSHHTVPADGGVRLPISSHQRDPVGGDISPDGKEVLVKMYHSVLYWYIPDKDYLTGMKNQPRELPYHNERQGESVCWEAHGHGYYTLSEGHRQHLYYYKRTSSAP